MDGVKAELQGLALETLRPGCGTGNPLKKIQCSAGFKHLALHAQNIRARADSPVDIETDKV